ncbi:MAG: 5-oxoprolinase subunit PxpA [Sphingomonadaceae bacterium]
MPHTSPRAIDLNADLGEGYGPWRMGDDAAMLAIVSSASIACGGHAGDPETMFETLRLARAKGVVAGAHPGYPDREGFGRRRLPHAPAEITRFLVAQVGALMGSAALAGTSVRFVKPHGALGNIAAAEREVADAVVAAVRALGGGLSILAIAASVLARRAEEAGVTVFHEVFADRGYTRDGQLVPRALPGALLHDPAAVSARMLAFLETGRMPTADGSTIALPAHSVCLHGDTPGAVALARRLRADLEAAGVAIRPFAAP